MHNIFTYWLHLIYKKKWFICAYSKPFCLFFLNLHLRENKAQKMFSQQEDDNIHTHTYITHSYVSSSKEKFLYRSETDCWIFKNWLFAFKNDIFIYFFFRLTYTSSKCTYGNTHILIIYAVHI